jgi:hypothetical protein
MIDSCLGNIAAHLPAMAEKQPDALAVACPPRRLRLFAPRASRQGGTPRGGFVVSPTV